MRARLLSIHQPKNVCGEVLGYCNLASTVVCCHTNMTVCVICVLFTSCTHVIVQATFHRSALVGHWTFDAGAELRDLNGQICCCCSVNASIFDCRTLKVNDRHNVDDRLGGHEQSHQRLPWIRYCRKNVCCLCSNSIGLTRGGQVRRWRRQMSATTTDSIIGTTLRCSRCLASSRRTVPLDGR